MVKTLKLGKKMRDTSDRSKMGDFQYRSGGVTEGVEYIRVWRTSWFSDQFENLTREEFEQFWKWADRFSFAVIEAEED